MQKSTRPKKHKVPMDCPREKAPGDFNQQGAVGEQPTDSHNVTELSNLLRGLMQQQTDWEVNWEQDRQRQEERWRRIQHQFAQLQQEVHSENWEHQ